MFKTSKLNVKNVISDLHNISELVTGCELRNLNGSPRFAVSRSIALRRHHCTYKKHKNKEITLFSKLPILKSLFLEKASNPISSLVPFTRRWLNPENVCWSYNQPKRLFHNTDQRLYFEVQSPQCPPSAPKRCADKEPKDCASAKKSQSAKTDCGGSSSSEKKGPKPCPCRKMSTFTVPLNFYRHYAKNPCPPRKGGGKKSSGGGKGPICPPQKKVPDCSKGSKGGSKKGGAMCPPQKKIDCSKGSKGGGGKKRNPCGKPKKAKHSSKGGKGPKPCGGSKPPKSSQKKPRKCEPKKGGSGGGGGKKDPLIKRASPCKPKGKSGGKSGKSGRKCK